jgi:cell division transport system permease protein
MPMSPNTTLYLFRESFRSLKRNSWLNFAAAGTTAVSLFVLGIAILLVINTNSIAQSIESNVEIMVYANHGVNANGLTTLRQELESIPGVKDTQFVSKDEALHSLEGQFGQDSKLKASVGDSNPLPDAYKVRIDDPHQVAQVAKTIGQLPDVYRVRYGQGVVDTMFKITAWVRLISIAIMVLLAVCAVFLIATTIRLTMFSRRKEINIMKYVGATDWFVRWPFLLEGIIIGGCGALVSIAILYFSYSAVVIKLHETLTFLPLVASTRMLWGIFGGLFGAGVLLGITGSMITVRRYLHV